MKIAFVIYEGLTTLDFIGVYDPLTRLKTMGFIPDLEWEICANTDEVRDNTGMHLAPTSVRKPLFGYDLLVVPGGFGTRRLVDDSEFLDWLRTAEACPLKASVCTGALLLGAAGFLKGRRATTHPRSTASLQNYGAEVVPARIVDEGEVITAGGVTSAIDLGLYLCEKLAGEEVREKIRVQMDYCGPEQAAGKKQPAAEGTSGEVDRANTLFSPAAAIPPGGLARLGRAERQTAETRVSVELNLDGHGKHVISTGIGFLDHMLTHLAVHGLFDLRVQATGDLHIDVHHTVEDVALALGQAFAKALGERAGLVRMGSAYAPMDEALAFVAVDLSGRPYAVVQASWRTPGIGNIPTSLFPHFLESFAATSRCNLHARVLAGADDHHQAEALFKALARALDAATQIDLRRTGAVPSTKGTLTA